MHARDNNTIEGIENFTEKEVEERAKKRGKRLSCTNLQEYVITDEYLIKSIRDKAFRQALNNSPALKEKYLATSQSTHSGTSKSLTEIAQELTSAQPAANEDEATSTQCHALFFHQTSNISDLPNLKIVF